MSQQQTAREGMGAQAPQYGELRTRAWLSEPGWFRWPKDGFLELREGRVRFVTNGGAKVFDSPLDEVQGEFPMATLGGGAKITVAGQRYYISFYPPGGQSIVAGIVAIKAGRRWKDVLTRS